ncbi:hypothetical protein ACOSP7_005504 [Xanthoceras sorbifolium]|uniref:Uncharacterized protein n=1 Tax=Xanthoceras sorbifolium TaxID=99658 RepID=A0ABQ8IEL9_9ROSI|nr:hypothetical protein JRO89_XS02G0048900 [Xanthoceras sorbifolium]
MKSSLFAFIFLFSLLLSANFSYGRKEPAATGDYWKSIMKDQPMPKALLDRVQQEESAAASGASKIDHYFVKDFDFRPSAILYHTHSHKPKEDQMQVKPQN